MITHISSADQKIVGNSLQPIGVIITGNPIHVESYNRCYWSVRLDYEARISQFSLKIDNPKAK